MKKQKVFIIGGYYNYFYPYRKMFEVTSLPHQADIFLFAGGEDINPSLYNQNLGSLTGPINQKRDYYEQILFRFSKEKGGKNLGICRGAQFLTAMSGGTLVQHVENHAIYFGHEIFSKLSQGSINVSSLHHQMMNPFDMKSEDYELIAWSLGLSGVYLNENDQEIEIFHKQKIEPEIVYYPKTTSLCIQAHPEMMFKKSQGLKLFLEVIDNYLNKK